MFVDRDRDKLPGSDRSDMFVESVEEESFRSARSDTAYAAPSGAESEGSRILQTFRS